MNFDLNKLGKTASVLFLALAMAGCGGGSSDTAELTPSTPPAPPAPLAPPADVDLMGSTDLMPGMTTIPADGSVTVGDTTISCAGDEACMITVVKDDVTGLLLATSTGGTVTVSVAEPPPPPMMYAVDLMGSTDLMAGMTTIPTGTSVTVGRTTVTCPDGGADCALTVSEDAVTGMMTASATGAAPMVTVAPIIYYADLPKKHQLMDGETFTVDAGETHKMGGVEFDCPAGGGDCVVTIMENEDGDLVASYTGGDKGLTAMQLTPRGYFAFIHSREGVSDLSDTILDRTDLDSATAGIQTQLDDLRMNNFHGGAGTTTAGSVPGRMFVSMGGAGVTSSVTTHEDPESGDPNVTGVSDIAVTAITTATDPSGDDDDRRIVVVDRTADGTLPAPATTIENVVLADGSTAWRSSISAAASWPGNTAAEWMSGALPSDDTGNMDDDADDIWTAYFQHVDDDLAGGRTLELDLRTDFGAGARTHRPYVQDEQTIVRGPGGNNNEVTVAWTTVTADIFPLGLGTEVDLSTDGGVGLEGSYMGVAGRFVCMDGEADGGTADGECKIDHQTSGQMGVSEEDEIVFLPYMHGNDTNWLAAGVWLTIPDDEENGDYAIGAFVFGNDPWLPSEADARAITGRATYNGEAFGRYAENSDVEAGGMMVGRFQADVTLTANFDAGGGATGGSGNDFGTISGDAENFVADGDERDWDVNFETATIRMDGPDAAPVDSTLLRFHGTASGHGDGGKATTGYWNGQFYGTPENNDDNPMVVGPQTPWGNDAPGSAAGTFGLTSERDARDNYLLIMEGAFAAHQDTD